MISDQFMDNVLLISYSHIWNMIFVRNENGNQKTCIRLLFTNGHTYEKKNTKIQDARAKHLPFGNDFLLSIDRCLLISFAFQNNVPFEFLFATV